MRKPNSEKKSQLDFRVRSEKELRYPCVKFEQATTALHMFAMPATELWDCVQINQREENKDAGYQRVLSPARAEKVTKFIDAGNAIPLSVLVSFDHASYDDGSNEIVIKNRADAGWVIDGQHRLAGARGAKTEYMLPVIALLKLGDEEQINFFVTINREQKGVPSSLYYELLKHLPGTKTESEIISQRASDLATALKTDEESPFYGKIVSTSSPKKGEMSLTNFVRKVTPLIKRKTGRLANESDEKRSLILNNYYKAVEQVFPAEFEAENCVFFRTLGFGAIMNALPSVIDFTVQDHGSFNVANVVRVLNKISSFDFSVWQGLSGNQGEEIAGDQFVKALMDERDDPIRGIIKTD